MFPPTLAPLGLKWAAFFMLILCSLLEGAVNVCVRDYSFFTIYGYDLIKEGVLYKVLPLLTEHSGLNPVEIIISNHLNQFKNFQTHIKIIIKKETYQSEL